MSDLNQGTPKTKPAKLEEQAIGSLISYNPNESPSHLLHRAQQFAAELHIAALGAQGLTQRQLAVLAVLAHQDGVSQSDLVAKTGIDRSTLAEMVARMVTKGLATRVRSQSDSRANAVSLTELGRTVFEAALPKLADNDAGVLARLPSSKRALFVDLLKRLALPDQTLVAPAKADKKKKDKKKKKKKDKRSK
ncbi:MarR family winged helix-turn-helix transcriptional regulator [Candidatus Phycosocius spiralis]|nr:MarR family winged helix-turn-helix transcriptional regulator [Candidatus Phycosocius spiralis]